jgi:VanZ family protein
MPASRAAWSLICAAVLAIILLLGLWPFYAPANEVTWLKDRPGLEFGRFGSAFASDTLPSPGSVDSGGSVELWLRPGYISDSSTVLAFAENPLRFSVHQSLTDLAIQAKSKLYVNEVFRKRGPFFLTITSGAPGTSVYVNGSLVRTAPRFRLSTKHFTGRLVVADAPGQSDSWHGQLYGLALYHRRLEASEVLRHYSTWIEEGRPKIAEDERNVTLYLFQERAGKFIHNSARPGLDLQIPDRYTVVDKIFLEPFWQEFSLSESYLSSAVKNIVGFVPFGFCFYGYLLALRVKRAALATVLLGTAVSVTIEVLQAYLPTRDSGTTDIFTNTLGTWVGVASFRIANGWIAQRAPAASGMPVPW